MKIAIYGIGNFGYSILRHLDKYRSNTEEIYAFDRDIELIECLKTNRKHLFFHKGVRISERINFTSNTRTLARDSDVIILAVPSHATREALKKVKLYIKKDVIILNTAKALDFKTGKRLSEITRECLSDIKYSYALLAGGTIAIDLFKQEPLGIDVASNDKETLKLIKNLFESNNLNVYMTQDLLGVEYASAFKNVISILAGIVKGIGFSYGSETHLVSRAAKEIESFAMKQGSKVSTFSMSSQCWGNDLWMSCTGKTRNREFGILIGRGYKMKEVLNKMKKQNKTVEGINTLKIINKLFADKENYPIINGIIEIVIGGKYPKETILNLMKTNKI